jgi:hypothetical protein
MSFTLFRVTLILKLWIIYQANDVSIIESVTETVDSRIETDLGSLDRALRIRDRLVVNAGRCKPRTVCVIFYLS